MRTRGLVLGGIVGAALVGATWFVTAALTARPIGTFDPDRPADLETRMWQTYYDRSRARLFRLLVVMLRGQYEYSWATAVEEAFHLARAASTFADVDLGYERVLPDLEHAYQAARDRHDARFDPAAVARAELAWWVARRIPGTDSPEQVGDLMADEYALLYGQPRDES